MTSDGNEKWRMLILNNFPNLTALRLEKVLIDEPFMRSLERLELIVVIFKECKFDVGENAWCDFYRYQSAIREFEMIWK